MRDTSHHQYVTRFGQVLTAVAASLALIVGTASPVFAQSPGDASDSSPAAPQAPLPEGADDAGQAQPAETDPAAVVEDLPEIAPETSLPAAPPPSDAATRSDGTEPGSQVPTGRGGEARTAPQALQAETLDEPWEPTENPKATVEPGQMRSDREEIPEGFSKEEADKAETMEARLQGGGAGGMLRAAVAPGCQVYWPAPYEVCGAIRDKYNALGGPNSFLLFPKTGELTNPDRVGKRTEFVNGPIYWSPQGGAHPVVNHFLAAWARHGYEASYIGYPTTDEIVNPDGIGRRQHFTGSTIYWRLNEAYSIGGAIQDKWNSLGAERGQLGYPISDELVLPDGQGCMNRFEKGVIYWHPTTGAHFVTGNILDQWSSGGFELAALGYPLADPEGPVKTAPIQRFQNGTLAEPSVSVPLLGTNEQFSVGVPALANMQVRQSSDGFTMENDQYLFKINPYILRSWQMNMTIKSGAPRSFSMYVGLPKGYSLRAVGDSRIELVPPTGRVMGSIAVPYAGDNNGNPVPVRARVIGNKVTYDYGQLETLPRALAAGYGDLSSWMTTAGNGLDKYANLGRNERALCKSMNYYQCIKVGIASKDAAENAETHFPSGEDDSLTIDNRNDATRHRTWQGLITERLEEKYAVQVGEAHELDWPSAHPDSDAMDRYNNETGRKVGLRNEDNSGGIRDTCGDYAAKARVTIPPPTSNPRADDLVILRDRN